ncbi:MAG TPA: hypothetical protein VGR81_07990 [Candidatus Acidoferrales bacterium]|nr:hypothetical protein [Candidatus Acidoferrales bacterium]
MASTLPSWLILDWIEGIVSLKDDSITELVAALSSAERQARESAARELYRRGRELAESAIVKWRTEPEIGKLLSDHATVGIVVTPEHFFAIRKALGNPRLAQVPPDQDAEEFEWDAGDGAHLDILTTRELGGTGAIARFLAKMGEGIQQVEFLTPDVTRAAELIHTRLGIAAIYPSTRAGADGTRVNFFLTDVPNGKKILIELVEKTR